MVMNFSKHSSVASLFLPCCALLLGACLLLDPHAAANGFLQGGQLCVRSVLPALFPFFVICHLVVESPVARRLGLPLRPLARACGIAEDEAGTVLLLSWLGGYAACAQILGQLRRSGQLSERSGVLLLLVGCCSGPGFVIGCIGGQLLGSVGLGVMLYVLQLSANLLAAACLVPLLPHFCSGRAALPCPPPGKAKSGGPSLSAAIDGGVTSSLGVCGCVIFFRMVQAVLLPLLAAFPLAPAFCAALLEISGGCADFAALGGKAALYGICFCLSILGFSVFTQLAALLHGTIPLAPLYFARGLHVLFLCGLVRLAGPWLPGAAAVFSTLAPRVIATTRLAPDAAWVSLLFFCALLYKGGKRIYNK